MNRTKYIQTPIQIFIILLIFTALAICQSGGKISGKVTFGGNGAALPNATVQIVQMKRIVNTDGTGSYEFRDVPAGRYTVIAHSGGFEDSARVIVIVAGGNGTVDLTLSLTGVREQVTVTATGVKQAAFDAVQPTIAVGSQQIIERGSVGLGDALSNQSGVAARTATPASSRPVIRGFDGDRVLIAMDGFRLGSISALAGNEGEPLDLFSLDRIEVVRGPSTLLYGSNAIGGVVNAISRHDDDIGRGFRGYATVIGGTNNGQAVGSGGLEYGRGKWGVWGSGTLQRTNDYSGGGNFGSVENTATRMGNANGGFGYFSTKAFFTTNYNYYRNSYGIPVDPADPEERTANIAAHRNNFRISGGFRDLGSFIESVRLTLDYSKYFHRESEVFDHDPKTRRFSEFFNDVYSYRASLQQRRHGNLSGTFGFDGYHRKFHVNSSEALIDGIVTQSQNSVFALEKIDLERVTFQFGGRVENSRYRPSNVRLPKRDMTGFSGAFGMRVGLWANGAFTANYSHSTRLPDLEEFYNDGPHDDTVSFEIGNPNLRKEVSDGIDLSIRHQAGRFRANGNFFYYGIKNFVYLRPTGVEDVDTGLEIANYVQANSRFYGVEGNLDFDINRFLGVFSGVDYVRARFTSGVNLPRIPPFRGRVGVDAHFHGVTLRPEFLLAHSQNRVFTDESPTDGYVVFNLIGSYTFMLHRVANIFSVNGFNLTNKLYFNHVSYIKDYTPEIGRGVRFNYTVRFF